MKKDAKNQFLNFLESMENEDPALIEAFNKSFNALFEANMSDLLKIYGSVDGNPVLVEINIENVDGHYVPLTRGATENGLALEPDDGDYWEIEDIKATAKITPLNDDGEPTGTPTVIGQADFPKVVTERKGYNPRTRKIEFFNLDDYISEMVQENADHFISDNTPDYDPDDRY